MTKEKLQEFVAKSQNAKYIYCFATMVKNADIDLLEDAIIKTNSIKYLYKFLLDVNIID